MKSKDYQAEKLDLIAWITQLQDVSVIKKLKHIREDTIEVKQWQKDVVRERIRKSAEKPERIQNWEEVKDDFIFD